MLNHVSATRVSVQTVLASVAQRNNICNSNNNETLQLLGVQVMSTNLSRSQEGALFDLNVCI